MSLPTLDLSYLRLTYRPDLQTLFLRWTRPVTTQEHKEGYTQALAMAQPLQAGHWLIDLRTRGLATAEEFAWVLTDFRREMERTRPVTGLRIAYLVTPYQQEVLNSRLGPNETLFRTFIEEQTASQWLAGTTQPSAQR